MVNIQENMKNHMTYMCFAIKNFTLCFASGKKEKNKFNKFAKCQGWKLTCMFVEEEERTSVCCVIVILYWGHMNDTCWSPSRRLHHTTTKA